MSNFNTQAHIRHYFLARAYSPVEVDQALLAHCKRRGLLDSLGEQPAEGALWLAQAEEIARLSVGQQPALRQLAASLKGGRLLWEEFAPNLMFTTGLNRVLDTYYDGNSELFRVGIYKGTNPVAGDTYTTKGYTEETAYTGNRKTPAFSAAAAGSKTTSAAMVFSVNGAFTGNGGILIARLNASADTPGDATGGAGVLIGSGAFSSSRTLGNGDTLNVNLTATLT